MCFIKKSKLLNINIYNTSYYFHYLQVCHGFHLKKGEMDIMTKDFYLLTYGTFPFGFILKYEFNIKGSVFWRNRESKLRDNIILFNIIFFGCIDNERDAKQRRSLFP